MYLEYLTEDTFQSIFPNPDWGAQPGSTTEGAPVMPQPPQATLLHLLLLTVEMAGKATVSSVFWATWAQTRGSTARPILSP